LTPMSDEPNFADLARQYLDLWEDQLTAMAADPDIAKQSAQFFEAMTHFGKVANPLLAANFTEFVQRTQTGNRNDANAPSADGTTAPAPASGDSDERMDQLAQRLADIERRLGELETGAGRKGSKP
jgi:hypothetical protein